MLAKLRSLVSHCITVGRLRHRPNKYLKNHLGQSTVDLPDANNQSMNYGPGKAEIELLISTPGSYQLEGFWVNLSNSYLGALGTTVFRS